MSQGERLPQSLLAEVLPQPAIDQTVQEPLEGHGQGHGNMQCKDGGGLDAGEGEDAEQESWCPADQENQLEAARNFAHALDVPAGEAVILHVQQPHLIVPPAPALHPAVEERAAAEHQQQVHEEEDFHLQASVLPAHVLIADVLGAVDEDQAAGAVQAVGPSGAVGRMGHDGFEGRGSDVSHRRASEQQLAQEREGREQPAELARASLSSHGWCGSPRTRRQ